MNDGGKIKPKVYFLARSLGMAFLLCLSLASCTGSEPWQEEVRLSNGAIINIDREVKYASGGAAWPRGQGSIPREHIIRFKYPTQSDKLIEWRSRKLDSSTYSELPLVLDLAGDKTWFIFTLLALSSACDQYFKYEFKNGAWTEIPLPDDIEVHTTNLTLKGGALQKDKLISISAKAAELREIGYRWRLKKVGPKRFACVDQYRGPYPPTGAI